MHCVTREKTASCHEIPVFPYQRLTKTDFKWNLSDGKVVHKLKGRLQLQQNVFTKATAKSDAAVKAEEITRASKYFSEGAFVKRCKLKVCEQVCPDQNQTFNNISLSRNTIADRVKELADNLTAQLVEESRSYLLFRGQHG